MQCYLQIPNISHLHDVLIPWKSYNDNAIGFCAQYSHYNFVSFYLWNASYHSRHLEGFDFENMAEFQFFKDTSPKLVPAVRRKVGIVVLNASADSYKNLPIEFFHNSRLIRNVIHYFSRSPAVNPGYTRNGRKASLWPRNQLRSPYLVLWL